MLRRAANPWGVLALVLAALLGGGGDLCPQTHGGSGPEVNQGSQADALFTNGILQVLKIEIPKEGMRSLRRDPRRYVQATLREGPMVFSNVMVRLKGGAGSFRPVDDKPGLTVKMEKSGRLFHGLKKFHLNNSVQDDTCLSEWMSSEVFRQAGVPAARAAHAAVELNGRRLGLYVLLESINSDFLAQYFNETHGNIYSLGANADITGPLERNGGREETDGAELRALAAAARESDRERLRLQLPKVLDMPRFISFMAVEVLLDHWDGYTRNIKNYTVYHDPETDKIVFMPHDLDQVLRDANAPINPNGVQGIVARAILRHPETRAQYQERFKEVFTHFFVAPVLTRRIDEQLARLAPQLKQYDPDLAQEFVSRAGDLKGRIARRARALAVKFK